jgi:hypothetical protein
MVWQLYFLFLKIDIGNDGNYPLIQPSSFLTQSVYYQKEIKERAIEELGLLILELV